VRRIESAGLLVRSVPYGEADIIATFFTKDAGKVSAIVRGAGRSSKRFAGALEPIHELLLSFDDKGKELCVLKEARIGRARHGIVSDLDALEHAGRALRWVRHLCPARTPEPDAWRSLATLFDALDGTDARADAESNARLGSGGALASFGLRLLADVGYALELDRCLRCGRACPDGKAAFVDAAGGGIVCTSCGGARRTISGDLRALGARAQRGEDVAFLPDDARALIEIVEDAMAAHADFDQTAR
jgi:DNA repair protein RecO (recombination protein O)